MRFLQKTEQIVIKDTDPRFGELDNLEFLSKNLYNAAMYIQRQHFFKTGKYHSFNRLVKILVSSRNADYYALKTKVSQWTVKLVYLMWKAFDAALRDYEKHPRKYTGRPRIPGYLDKKNGRFPLHFTSQAISQSSDCKKENLLKLSGIESSFNTTVPLNCIKMVRIVNRGSHIVLEVIYEVECPDCLPANGIYASMDPGMRNLATITFSIPEIKPVVIDGSDILGFNNLYNREIAKADSLLSKRTYKKETEEFNALVEENKRKKEAGENTERVQFKGKRKTKRKTDITNKRNRRIKSCLHKYSHYVVNLLVSHSVSIFFIGKNKGWKQDIALGDRINQNFVQIPYAQFIEMLKYKCKEVGIRVVTLNESYTSKCSFLDLERICKHKDGEYAGERVTRGLFKSKDGTLINADVNGAYNIMRRGLAMLKMDVTGIFSKETVSRFGRHPKRIRIGLG